MKVKLIFLACVSLIAAQSAASQSAGVQIGVEGGASIAMLTGTGVSTLGARTSAYFGASLIVQAEHSPFGFETGIAYVPKGAVNSMPGTRIDFETHYIEVPLLLRMKLPLRGSRVTPTFAVGASIGFLGGCRIAGTSASLSSANDCDSPALGGSRFNLRSVDVGMTAKAGVDIPLSTKFVLAPAVAYTRGISTISSSASAPDAVNSAFKLGVALRWRL